MKNFFIKKEFTALTFLFLLLTYSMLNLHHTYPFLKSLFLNKDIASLNDVNTLTDNLEYAMQDNFFQKYSYIENYGALQLLLEKHEMNQFSIGVDRDGFLHPSNFIESFDQKQAKDLAKNVSALKKKLDEQKTELLVMTPPDRFYDGKINGYLGIPYSNFSQYIDLYYNCLSSYDIDSLDLRPAFIHSGLAKEQLYYKTDHHWTIRGAFLAFQELITFLNENYALQLDPDGYYRDWNHYTTIHYPNAYLGSYGRKTGAVYAGLDDFDLILPKFNTSFEFKRTNEEGFITYQGSFEDTLINKSILTIKDLFQQDLYSCYLDGVLYSYGKITNRLNPNGAKILLIRDSYSSPLAAFLSSVCGEVDVLYPVLFEESILSFLSENHYDMVILSGYCGTLPEKLIHF
ncbi:DHHW family protein [Anaeromicropila populeti]|uniref:SGNH hydrolase-like domain-containing protein, acetyltransferase AlgX n=1 Tax=Anaeromicropila populeti TaxID=37658 RepID=A0A1I6JBQ9_9FIRM|nr:DHHW family protein [Anaeromicropila populeti]SFR76453.1 SGNH hydrolase-like domain-containing protein, acetyltransferase AlgX [Anaeromicropila populeti]